MYEHLDEIGLQNLSEMLGDRIYGARVRERERLPNTGCNHAASTSRSSGAHQGLVRGSSGAHQGHQGLVRGSSGASIDRSAHQRGLMMRRRHRQVMRDRVLRVPQGSLLLTVTQGAH